MAKRFPDPTDIRTNPDVGGGSLYDMGPYVISACNLLYQGTPYQVVVGLDPISSSASTARRAPCSTMAAGTHPLPSASTTAPRDGGPINS